MHSNSPWACVIKFCSNGGATFIFGEITVKIQFEHSEFNANFENVLLQNYSTEFLDIALKSSLSMCTSSLFRWWCHLNL